ncbi:MAG: MoaD/ThiS family protein [Anaerolineales bacterium]|nr:MoaD/ThiS family protein [Anaerolineales bacterium]
MARLLLKIFSPLANETGLFSEAGIFTLEEEITERERLSSMLRRLIEKYGEKFYCVFFDAETEKFKRTILITLNTRLLVGEDRLETELADGDIVVLMPTIPGG